jgi:hypothetical protein
MGVRNYDLIVLLVLEGSAKLQNGARLPGKFDRESGDNFESHPSTR